LLSQAVALVEVNPTRLSFTRSLVLVLLAWRVWPKSILAEPVRKKK